MKKLKLVGILLIFVSGLLLFPPHIWARVAPEDCLPPCAPGDCSGNCSLCSWCSVPPPEPTEEPDQPIRETEIYNPALSNRVSQFSGTKYLQKFLQTGVRLGFVVGAVVFFFLLLTGAIKWIASGSDKAQIEGSQKQITHALVGLVILLSIFAIISIIESIFGISITNINLPIL